MSTLLLAGLSGCMLLNNVVQITDADAEAPDANSAMVIYGIGVEGAWDAPEFAVALDEYDMERQSITGNCWRYNRMLASVPKDSRVVQHFIFEVTPGYYSFSGFNATSLGASAFLAPAGQIVYLGDFIYSDKRTVVLRRNEDKLKMKILKKYPKLVEKITPADAVSIKAPTMFLCMP